MAAVRRGQTRPSMTRQEHYQHAFARVRLAATAVEGRWGLHFRRMNNCFTDPETGRTLQVVSGKRPDLTGVYRFTLQQTSVERLRTLRDAWVALVPDEQDVFLLVPSNRIPWRGESSASAHLMLRFDDGGLPPEFAEWAVPLRDHAEPGA
jgi:hypothetical protein